MKKTLIRLLLLVFLSIFCFSFETQKKDANNSLSIDYLIIVGNNSFKEGNFNKSIEDFKKALEFYQKEKNINYILKCQLNIIKSTIGLNKFDTARILLDNINNKNSYTSFLKNNNELLCQYYGLQTKYYVFLSKQDSVLKYYNKTIAVIKTLDKKSDDIQIDLYNDVGNFFLETNDFKKAASFYKNAYKILDSQEKSLIDTTLLSRTLTNLGNLQFYASNYDSAFYYYNKSGWVVKQCYGNNHPQLARAYENMGLVLELKCNYNSALDYYNKSLKIYKYFLGDKHISIAEIYASIGTINFKRRDFGDAKLYFTKEYNIYYAIFGEKHPTIGLVNKNLGIIEMEMSNFNEAKILFDLALQNIKSNYGENHSEVAEIYLELGNLAQKTNEIEKSINYFKKALIVSEKIEGDLSENKGDLFFALAESYSLIKQWKMSNNYAFKSIAIFKQIYKTNKHPKIIQNVLLISNNYLLQNYYSDAIKFCDIAIRLGFDKKAILPSDLNNKNLLFDFSVLEGIEHKTKILKKENLNLKQGLSYSKMGLSFSKKLLQSTNSIQGQIVILESISHFCENGAYFANSLFIQTDSNKYIEDVFLFMESNKANLLKIRNQNTYAISYNGIPKAIIKKEEWLKNEISFLKNEKLYQLEICASKEKIYEIQDKLFEKFIELDKLIHEIEVKYPEYHKLKYNVKTLKLSTFKNKMNRNAVLLEYLETDSGYLLLQCDKKHSNLFSLHIPNKNAEIENLIKSVVRDNEYAFPENAYNMYTKLIPKTIINELKNKTLFIIREGSLQNVPFEMLITEKPIRDGSEMFPYLLFKNPILYNFSSNFILEKKKYPFFYNTKIWAISWLNPKNPLIGAKNETKSIASIFSGQTILDNNLSETIFKKKVSQYSINHIATHSWLNDSIPLLSFLELGKDTLNDGKLFAYELYNILIPAELSCLSACETGLGKMVKGDVPQSISRAFYYAGCKNLLLSKWKIPDQSSSLLMGFFYKNLKNNFNKTEALQKAKIDFLAERRRYTLSPMYWAGYELYGNQYDLKISRPFYKQYFKIVCCLSALFLSLFIAFKLSKKSNLGFLNIRQRLL